MKTEQAQSSGPGRWFLLLPALTVLALLIFGIGSSATKTSLYFFDKTGQRLVAERRVIPLVGSVETRTITLLEELLLGPADHSHIAVMPATTRLLAVMHRGNLLIVNLAVDALQGFTIDFPRIYEALEKTLLSGIPGYGSLELFINGKLTSK